MAPGLIEQTIARVDQQNREIGGRRAGGHVARVLLMTRRIRQNEPPPAAFRKTGKRRRSSRLVLVPLPIHRPAARNRRRLPRCRNEPSRAPAPAITSSGMEPHSNSSRPISVDLPSSTLPQVRTRRRESGIRNSPRAFSFPSTRLVPDRSGGRHAPTFASCAFPRRCPPRCVASDSTAADSG